MASNSTTTHPITIPAWDIMMAMREDAERTKNKKAAANLVVIRNIAFDILKSKHKFIKYAPERFANYSVKK